MIEVNELSKVFRPGRKGEIAALDDVGFSIAAGELVGVLGPNGAGKTTLVKCLCTLVRPTSGTIEVVGVDVVRHPRAAVANVAAVLEGNRNVYWRLSVRENLDFFASLHGHSARSVRAYADELVERFSLTEKRDAPARQLSRGMQQKLAVACALVRQTPVLLLDEPTLGLDVETSIELRSYLRSLNRTILITSHDMHLVQDLCPRVIIVDHGRILTDDRVEKLLALFRAQAYRITVAGTVDAAALQDRFPLLEVTYDGEGTAIDVELASGDAFYDLMEALRAAGCAIEGIDRKDPNLEQIFMQIVKARA